MSVFGKRSKEALQGVAPNMVKLMNAAIVNPPIDFGIDAGVRSAATQKMYYSWGRTVVNPNTGPVKGNFMGMTVTNKDGVIKKSNHQIKADGFGHAVDIYPYYNGSLQTEDEKNLILLASHIKKIAKSLGIAITWGGDWKKPYDPPHFELK